MPMLSMFRRHSLVHVLDAESVSQEHCLLFFSRFRDPVLGRLRFFSSFSGLMTMRLMHHKEADRARYSHNAQVLGCWKLCHRKVEHRDFSSHPIYLCAWFKLC